MGQWAKGKMKEIKGLQYGNGAATEGKSFAEIGVFGWIREAAGRSHKAPNIGIKLHKFIRLC